MIETNTQSTVITILKTTLRILHIFRVDTNR